ncbi:MAG: hypothetical protein P8170_16450 [Gemmatimonadota bacterium]
MTTRTLPLVTATLLLWIALADILAAQETVRLYGRILDASTGRPVYGASFHTGDARDGDVTDTLGLFVLEVPEAEEYTISAGQLGYRTALVTLPATAPREFTTLLLEPDPIAVEGLEVLVDRFERRRRLFIGSVTTLDQETLRRAPARSAYDLLMANLPAAGPCGDHLCSVRRGRRVRVGLSIDEEPAYTALPDLERLHAADLYLIEIYERGASVRVYTRRFVARTLRSGKNLDPIQWGCGGI